MKLMNLLLIKYNQNISGKHYKAITAIGISVSCRTRVKIKSCLLIPGYMISPLFDMWSRPVGLLRANFNKVTGNGHFEIEFALFFDTCEDIISFEKERFK
jgi:hypothetical protein